MQLDAHIQAIQTDLAATAALGDEAAAEAARRLSEALASTLHLRLLDLLGEAALEIGAQPYGHWSSCHAVTWDLNAPEFGDRKVLDLFQKHSYPLGLIVNVRGERFVDEGADLRNYTYAKYGREILKHMPGRVSTEVDARLSFDEEVTVRNVHQLIKQYEADGASRDRVLIKVASTWEGIEAARVLVLRFADGLAPSFDPRWLGDDGRTRNVLRREEVLLASAKEGTGCRDVLEAVVQRVPSPAGDDRAPLRALVFDSKYDSYKGVIAYLRVVDGAGGPELPLRLMATASTIEPLEVGYFTPELVPTGRLTAGEVGYVATGLKDVRQCRVGDTLTSVEDAALRVRDLVRRRPTDRKV
jgi:hypothetical protein